MDLHCPLPLAAFLTQTICLDDATTVKFEIWCVRKNFGTNVAFLGNSRGAKNLKWIKKRDTAGQERYKSLAPMYYRNANCAVVVYDITQTVKFFSFDVNLVLL